jgi:hypothetical protein
VSAVLYAYNPNDLTQDYYDTTQNARRDKISSSKLEESESHGGQWEGVRGYQL